VKWRVLHAVILALAVTASRAGDVAADEIETLDDVADITDAWYSHPTQYPILDRSINVHTGATLRPGTILWVFDHRVREALSEDPFNDFLGFDAGGVKVGIGLRFGLLENTDVGVYRLNGTVEVFDTYEFDLRHRFLQQRLDGLDLATRVGVTWFSQKNMGDASGGFLQILAGKTWVHRVRIGTGLLYHSESSNAGKSDTDPAHSLAVPGTIEIRLKPSLSWIVEVVSAVGGYRSRYPVISSAFKIITYRHTFSLIVTNSQYITADGIVTNTGRDFSDASFGFTITKELNL